MSANVYFKRIDSHTDLETVKTASKELLEILVAKENIVLQKKIPLKVHFGEAKNVTFLKPETYGGVLEFLKQHDLESCYMETSVLYGGQRYKKELHEKTAIAHGFTQLPIIFADGEHGENYAEIPINLNHFKTFKVGKAFLDYDQLIVISHFKGHIFAGFGGAIKQLSMGHAAKGGKMAIHMGEKPRLISRKCKQCDLCKTRCNEDALVIGKKSWIDQSKCVGCGACMAICPHKAITIFSLKGILKGLGFGNPFIEKLVEGAYAACKGKHNIYINFAMSVTAGCDCEPKKMKSVIDDYGIFVSTDPVAIDKACYDMAKEKGKTFRGFRTFAYAEKIGLGSSQYTLHEID